jgi:hypothetical protein
VLRPLREFGPPALDIIQPMPYCAAQTMIDALYPKGLRYYWKAQYLPDISDELIDTMLAHFASVPSPLTSVILEHNGDGAITRIDEDATAFGYRDHSYIFIIISGWIDADDDDRNITWTRELYDAVRPFTRGGIYVNYLGQEGEDRVKEAYGTKYDRLVQLKNKYDPTNLFRVNQNIPPT